jgi:hypothetical protein
MNYNNFTFNNKRPQQPQQQKKTIHFSSDPFFFLYIYSAHFIAFLLRVYDSILSFWRPTTNNIPLVLDETQIYIEKHKKKFLDTFFADETETITLFSKEKWNENIDAKLYVSSELQELIIPENNDFELQWKRRLLQESTPRGNIIMYYDIYKQAFAYVSDQQMSYDILNACAMKYVRIYRCLDFFVDVNILPVGYISPFSLLQEEMDKKEKEKIIEKKKELGVFFDKSAPFIKLKEKLKEKSILKKTVSFVEEEEEEKKRKTVRDYRNMFRYLGKMSNLPLLMKIVPVKKHPTLSIPVESFDYVSFKKMQMQQQQKDDQSNLI